MANRSRRLRKKLRVDEFQEMGFDISFNFPVGTAEETIDAVVDALIDEVVEPRKAGLRRLGSPGLGRHDLHPATRQVHRRGSRGYPVLAASLAGSRGGHRVVRPLVRRAGLISDCLSRADRKSRRRRDFCRWLVPPRLTSWNCRWCCHPELLASILEEVRPLLGQGQGGRLHSALAPGAGEPAGDRGLYRGGGAVHRR